jgi:iron complex outermembrane recepter protein
MGIRLRLNVVFILALCFIAKCPFSGAQTTLARQGNAPLKSFSLEELGNVEVISTSKEPVAAWRTAAATYVITSEDIRRSGFTNVAEALRLAPGVEVSRISSTTWAIGIRGLQSNFSKSVLVLVDGRSVYTPLFAGVYWDVQDMVLEDIDRIEVIRGPGATIWGPNAVNGVINIITRNSKDTQGLLVSATVGDQDRPIAVVRYGGSIGTDFNYRVYAKGFAREPMFHADRNDFDAWHQERGGFRADWNVGNNALMFEGDIYGGTSPHLVATSVSTDETSGGSLVARWRRELSKGSDLYLQTYLDRTIRIGSQLGETRNSFDVDFLHHIKVGEHHDFSWGGGLRWSPNNIIQQVPSVNVLPHQSTDHVHSAFVQDEIQFLKDRVALTLGAKLQHNNYSGFDVQPTARILWAPNARQSFWAAITRAVTTPSRIEEDFLLTGQVGNTVLRVVGSHAFKSESMIGYEGGFRRTISPRFTIDVSAFHNRYEDLQSFGAAVTSVEATPPPPRTIITIPYGNAITGVTNGVEVAPSWQARPWWRLTGAYSYVGIDLHATQPSLDISSTGSVNTYENSTPHHQFNIHSTFNLPGGFEFDQFFRSASVLPAQKVSSYQTVDARLGWKSKSGLELSLVGQNLIEPYHYEWGTGDPLQQLIGIRRAIYGRVVWRR